MNLGKSDSQYCAVYEHMSTESDKIVDIDFPKNIKQETLHFFFFFF